MKTEIRLSGGGNMRYGFSVAMILGLSLSAPALAVQEKAEYVSELGRKFFSQPDAKGQVAEAEAKLAADARNVDLIIALGRAQGGIWRFRDAIATFSRGIEIDPVNAMLYRHRGHRYISFRQLDKALADLERASRLNDKSFDIWYHLGLAHYLKGDFPKAADAYEKCRAVVDKDDSLIAVSHWLYMSYRRAGKDGEAARVLDRITPDLKVEENKSYFELLLFYKGLKKETDIVGPEKTDLDAATTGYGVGNWHLYSGNKAKAREYFEKISSGQSWAAFGFIASETELIRMR
jgi:tetratricopeptide (TPR) repeat protein